MAKEKRKNMLTRDQTKEFIKDNEIQSVDDIQRVLKNLFTETLQGMLEAEMDSHLGYEKNDEQNKITDNRRNGHSSKIVRSDYGEVDLDIPRDRNSDFTPIIVKKGQRNVTGIEDQIIALYSKGISTRDIQSH